MEPAPDLIVAEAETDMGITGAQLLKFVAGEIDDQQPAARREQPRAFLDRRRRLLCEMQHLMQDDQVGRAVRYRQRIHVALAQLGSQPGLGQLRAGDAKHLRTAIDPQSGRGTIADQFDHPPGAGADIDHPTDHAVCKQRQDTLLYRAFRHMERADRIPMLGMVRKVARRCGRTIGPNRRKPSAIGDRPDIVALTRPIIDGGKKRADATLGTKAQENPASFLAALGEARVGEDLHVTRDARLALPENLGELADRKLHRTEKVENPQPGRIGESAEDGERVTRHHQDIKKSLYVVKKLAATAAPRHAFGRNFGIYQEYLRKRHRRAKGGFFMRASAKTVGALMLGLALSACTATRVGEHRLAEKDPLEGLNRGIWSINRGADKVIVKPVTRVYRAVTPKPARDGVRNFFANVGEPFSLINNLLQGKFDRASRNIARFAMNTTIGIGGLFDQASRAGVQPAVEDLGQTLAAWGANGGPYVVLPLFGPSTLRDTVGIGAAQFADPYRVCLRECGLPKGVPTALGVTQVISVRDGLIEIGADNFLESSLDPYAAARSAYLQRRRAEILNEESDEAAAEAAAAADAAANPIEPDPALTGEPLPAAPAAEAPAEGPPSPPSPTPETTPKRPD